MNDVQTDHSVDGALPLHPYYPLGVAVPNYVPNDMSRLQILSYFAVGCSIVLGTSFSIARRRRPELPASEVATVMWFALCSAIHLGMEGYVVYHSSTVASLDTVLGQAWKEYSHSDSRYLTQDNFVITMEAVTAIFWGPLCFLIACCIVTDHPLRHPLQIIVSLGQLYGDVLYYGTCAWDHVVWDIVYCRPEDYYFWFYFIFLNAFWIVIPVRLLVSSCKETARVFQAVRLAETEKKET